ncbi:DUF3224 domain-containing protein [Shewanella sp. Choline-02u-19]|jgi:hypothetical protein|uniref:DUF3224 domain-containing protein n=1 Tax=unclassified Shewanella TaxID=196818 RepID=UPI000C323187|nr:MULTISPECIES: DUF3224 domain-containing protein [unclassified Shewanella]PKG55593.1 DUF3224 domain-containing protein [Shewanella sp. GutDb-MelDb]PKG76549.1 DUF3224 domain-containing protein [Shewanella sp. GutCb]PKH55403.1 DUF3224 domain-containing protein [Shewanella sp. Bg11-22]PKI28750.1 DUF3224 domain-containing protein [Shewanella sp. Choline-02u-19]
MMVSGQFSIAFTPATDDVIDAGRMSFTKTFEGDISGVSQGQMLSKRTSVANSAAYVAMESFSGVINGLKGEVSFHHTGVMNRGADTLSVLVVPDSGTGELTGISGSMTIKIEAGVHHYHFDYVINA